MNYGEIISEAFRLAWRNRFLWFFGFFVAGGGGLFNFPSNLGVNPGGNSGVSSNGIGQFVSENLGLIVAAVALLAVLALIFIVLTLISQGALAESVAALHRGETRRFSSAWRTGISSFWRVLGQAILFFLIWLALLVAIVLPAILIVLGILAATESPGLRALFIGLVVLLAIIVFIVLLVALVVIGQFALRNLVVDGERVFGSVGAGYRLFRRNLGRSLLVWIIKVALSIGLGIAYFTVFLILGLVLVGPAVALFFAGYTTAGIVVGIVGGLLFLVIIVVISGALGTFSHAYWTLAYLRIVAPNEEAAP
jgi:membrane-anchored glycerophosphoryl diester phosphodiesterase (GDPDase)